MALYVLGFFVCALIIFFAGKRLSFYGDLLAELSGFGKAWVGLILMAAVTSLPELMVGISSAAIIQAPDLAVGDIIGSCAFNLGILSMMDFFTPKNRPLFYNISKSHTLAAAFGIILISLVGLNLYLEHDFYITPFLGVSSLSFLLVYLIAMKTIFNFQQNTLKQENKDQTEHKPNYSLKEVLIRYCIFALIIISAALFLPYFAEHIANDSGLAKSFVGTLFLAISTSLPEIAVSYAAIRMGSTDMAVGNLLGSNLFNVVVLFLDDIFYTNGSLLKDASDLHLLSVFFVLMMTGVSVIGFIFPSKEKRLSLAWDTLTIFSLYIINMLVLFFLSKK